jgi:hypothetical protein
MSAGVKNAFRRLNRRVEVCEHPHPREIADIATLLEETERLQASANEAWAITRKALGYRPQPSQEQS